MFESTSTADYLRHFFFSTSFKANRFLRFGIVASTGAPFIVVFHVAHAVYSRSYLRGNAISKAVDVVEVARRRFFEGKLAIKEISIGTEVLGAENER